MRALTAGKLAHLNNLVFLGTSGRGDHDPPRDEQICFNLQIISNSKTHGLAQLKNKTVSYPQAPFSMSAYSDTVTFNHTGSHVEPPLSKAPSVRRVNTQTLKTAHKQENGKVREVQ